MEYCQPDGGDERHCYVEGDREPEMWIDWPDAISLPWHTRSAEDESYSTYSRTFQESERPMLSSLFPSVDCGIRAQALT